MLDHHLGHRFAQVAQVAGEDLEQHGAVAQRLRLDADHAVNFPQGIRDLDRGAADLDDDDRVGLQLRQLLGEAEMAPAQDDDPRCTMVSTSASMCEDSMMVWSLPSSRSMVERLGLLAGIEAVGRLVEDQDRRVVEHGVGQADALAIALGERAEQPALTSRMRQLSRQCAMRPGRSCGSTPLSLAR